MRRKNPIGARLAFVRKQYPNRPEVFEITEGIVARALGVQSHEIDPDAYRKWEPTISWLAKNVNLLLKKRDAGANVDGQLKILSRSFAHIITPITDRPKHKGYRQVELATLSPKQARKFSSRLISEKVERRQEAAAQSGYRIVKNLGDGYIAAVGTPDLNAPPFPRNADIETQKRWVHDYAKFQGWVGAKLNNCLGFFNGYKIEYPIAKFKEQRDGGKLYAIIDRSGNPVSATLVNSENKVIETNGPNNQPPPESAVPYIEKLNKAMGLASKSVAFHPPQNFDIKITKVIEVILDSNRYFRENLRERRYFVRKAQGYSRQAGADFSKVWPKFVIHILATSKYSALVSVKKINYPKKDEIIAVILRVANLYKRGGSWQEFVEAADAAVRLKNVDSADVKTGAQTKVAVRAAMDTAMNAAIATCADGADGTEWPNLAAGHAKEALYSAASAAAEAALATRSDAAWDAAYKDYAGYLLKLLHEAASDAGRNLQAAARRNPRRSKRAKPVDPAISKCRGLWDSYYASPTKRNLAAVLKHLEIMKLSKSKTVLAERARCLRIARKERA